MVAFTAQKMGYVGPPPRGEGSCKRTRSCRRRAVVEEAVVEEAVNHLQEHQNHLQDHQNQANNQRPWGLLKCIVLMVLEVTLVFLGVVLVLLEAVLM